MVVIYWRMISERVCAQETFHRCAASVLLNFESIREVYKNQSMVMASGSSEI